jgi:hypothetical protein
MAFRRALDTQRRTGADPAGHRSGAAHGTAMEGYYWRVVDPGAGAVMVVLCGVCRGRADLGLPWLWPSRVTPVAGMASSDAAYSSNPRLPKPRRAPSNSA